MRRERVLFICTHNSARSQMAEGLLRVLGGDRFEAHSAGTEPDSVHPLARAALAELGIDTSGQRSQGIDEFAGHEFDVVVTVCDRAREACPVPPRGGRVIHQAFPDPAAVAGTREERLAAFRRVRDEIRAWLLSTLVTGPGMAHNGAPGRAREETMAYYFAKEIDLPFEKAVDAVTAALGGEGFGVLTDVDVQATLKAKLGAHVRPYRILGACNPSFAQQALEREPRIGLMLPCNVIVRETAEGGVEVAAIDPVASMQSVENPALGEIGLEVRDRLRRVIDGLGAT